MAEGRAGVRVARTRAELAAALRALRGAGGLGLVPTMGYLHEGHLSLVDAARRRAERVVVSIFVNPLQFGPSEDLGRYPRDLDRDLALLEARGADLVFTPEVDAMYPEGDPIVRVGPGRLGEGLCGAFRPGHFEGVLTVVAKLFHLVEPDVAVFGAKDYQQGILVRRMARELDFPLEVELAPIVREPDGLAMSSRNAHLAGEDRARAASLYRGLSAAREAFRAGEPRASILGTLVRRTVEEVGGRIQYVELVDAETLALLERARAGAVLAVAAHVGPTRLIDNVTL
ncbi:MAG TPA: pantoate--beta-alanine ligase [Longimicrobiales bacterium]|nr:pantoate--beta-alanine ligase [Longimicrobiales bacterium]